MRIRNILLTISLLYSCGIRITIKLPSIDTAWATELGKDAAMAEKVSKAFNTVVESCTTPVQEAENGHSIAQEDLNKCMAATTEGFKVYLELAGKEKVKKLLEDVITEIEGKNGQK